MPRPLLPALAAPRAEPQRAARHGSPLPRLGLTLPFDFDAIPDGLVLIDAEGTVQAQNPAAQELLGSVAGRLLVEVDEGLASLAAKAGPARGTLSLRGRLVEVRVAQQGAGRILVIRPRGRMQGSLGLAELTAGLAHELRNPLAGLKGAADLLAREVSGGPLEAYAKVISREATRLNGLVQQLTDLATPPPPRLTEVNLNAVVDEVLLLAQGFLPAGIRVERAFDPSLPPVPADRDQLVQVLINLVRNADDAMGGSGTLTISTGIAVGIKSETRSGPPRTMAKVVVRDDGPGFDEAVLGKLFTPFFSTKPGGSGLGLALCRGLIEAHGGHLEIDNAEGGGVMATVYLPAA